MPTGLALKAIGWGVISIALYAAMFLYERELLQLSVTPWFNVIVPITAAFIFSIVHGNFTSYFWDALGVKPNTAKKPGAK